MDIRNTAASDFGDGVFGKQVEAVVGNNRPVLGVTENFALCLYDVLESPERFKVRKFP